MLSREQKKQVTGSLLHCPNYITWSFSVVLKGTSGTLLGLIRTLSESACLYCTTVVFFIRDVLFVERNSVRNENCLFLACLVFFGYSF